MTEAYRSWDSIDRPDAWVRTVASRTWWRRNKRKQAESPTTGEIEMPPFDAELEEFESRYELLKILKTMRPGQREVMAWTYDRRRPRVPRLHRRLHRTARRPDRRQRVRCRRGAAPASGALPRQFRVGAKLLPARKPSRSTLVRRLSESGVTPIVNLLLAPDSLPMENFGEKCCYGGGKHGRSQAVHGVEQRNGGHPAIVPGGHLASTANSRPQLPPRPQCG